MAFKIDRIFALSLFASLLWSGAPHSATAGVFEISLAEVDYASVELWTIRPGEARDERFGNSALRIRSRDGKVNWVYHWAAFRRDGSPNLMGLISGRKITELSPLSPSKTAKIYRNQGRGIEAAELRLNVAEKNKLFRLINKNLAPKRRNYVFHYRKANSSTKIRDLLNVAMQGRLKKRFAKLWTKTTFREVLREGLGGYPFVSILQEFVVNGIIDRKANAWELMAFPLHLKKYLADIAATNQGERLLAKGRSIIAKPAVEPSNWRLGYYLAIAFGWGGAILMLLSLRSVLPFSFFKYGMICFALLSTGFSIISIGLGLFSTYGELGKNLMLIFLWPVDIFLVSALFSESTKPGSLKRIILKNIGWAKLLAFIVLFGMSTFRLIDRSILFSFLATLPCFLMSVLSMIVGMQAVINLRQIR